MESITSSQELETSVASSSESPTPATSKTATGGGQKRKAVEQKVCFFCEISASSRITASLLTVATLPLLDTVILLLAGCCTVQGPNPKRKVRKSGGQRQQTSGEHLFEIIMAGKEALQVRGGGRGKEGRRKERGIVKREDVGYIHLMATIHVLCSTSSGSSQWPVSGWTDMRRMQRRPWWS